MSNERRKYTKRRRAESEQETRQRITEAAVALHGSIGPARTTISAIADQAGVQRATVYRHFADEESLFAACSAHYTGMNPPPDLTAWSEEPDPGTRLRRALTEMYAWYDRTEPMLQNVLRDEEMVPAMAAPIARRRAYLGMVVDAVLAGRRERGHARRRVRAALTHALAFPTWQSLVRHNGLEDAEAVSLMAAMVEAAGSSSRAGNKRRPGRTPVAG
jgi:AcrR family transcriptional regulator